MSRLTELATLAANNWHADGDYDSYDDDAHVRGEEAFYELYPYGSEGYADEFIEAFAARVEELRTADRIVDADNFERLMREPSDSADQKLIDDFNHDDARSHQ